MQVIQSFDIHASFFYDHNRELITVLLVQKALYVLLLI
jgi:hypothetical protein